MVLELLHHPVEAKHLLPRHDDVADEKGGKASQGNLLEDPTPLEVLARHEVVAAQPVRHHKGDLASRARSPDVSDGLGPAMDGRVILGMLLAVTRVSPPRRHGVFDLRQRHHGHVCVLRLLAQPADDKLGGLVDLAHVERLALALLLVPLVDTYQVDPDSESAGFQLSALRSACAKELSQPPRGAMRTPGRSALETPRDGRVEDGADVLEGRRQVRRDGDRLARDEDAIRV